MEPRRFDGEEGGVDRGLEGGIIDLGGTFSLWLLTAKPDVKETSQRNISEELTPYHTVRNPERAWSLYQRCLVFPICWFVLLPVRNHFLRPRVCISLNMVVDHPIPFAPRPCLVHKDDDTGCLRALSSVCHLCKLLHKLLQPVHLEGGTHDDQKVGSFPHVHGLYLTDLIAKRVRFVVQYNSRPKRSDLQGTCRTCDSGFCWRAVSPWRGKRGQPTHSARYSQDNRVEILD